MDLDQRFRPSGGNGSRIILLGDGTEITTEAPDSEMFDNDEDKDLDSQVDKFHNESSNGNSAREGTPGPQSGASKDSAESPSSVKTEKSDDAPVATTAKDSTQPDKVTTGTATTSK